MDFSDTTAISRLLIDLSSCIHEAGTPNRDEWDQRLGFCYGALDGQRALTLPHLGSIENRKAIIAMETAFFLVTNSIALSAFQKKPQKYLHDVSTLTHKQFRDFLKRLDNGQLFEEHGIRGLDSRCDLRWILDCDSKLCTILQELIGSCGQVWDERILLLQGDDPFQKLQHRFFPSNLCHVSGQFFTPEWLAELLLKDIEFDNSKTLIDPYCGSGVFLLKALRLHLEADQSSKAALARLLGIEINPITAAAARANIALFLAQNVKVDVEHNINVLTADAIAPAYQNWDNSQLLWQSPMQIDGIDTQVSNPYEEASIHSAFESAKIRGMDISPWVNPSRMKELSISGSLPSRVADQVLCFNLRGADVVATNPPWVGWEYISRPYRKASEKGWTKYDLFSSTGLEAAFLKEDLSNLAMLTAFDRYLNSGGTCVSVLRPSTMYSEIASSGVRRLTINEGGTDLKLQRVRTFGDIKIFEAAKTDAITWQVKKGERTVFPVDVLQIDKIDRKRWSPSSSDRLCDVKPYISESAHHVQPSGPEARSRWMMTLPGESRSFDLLQGKNQLTPRMGVFTGGGNAIFYLKEISRDGGTVTCDNIVERAKRQAVQMRFELESNVVLPVIRGRDIKMWYSKSEVSLLFPHTNATGMQPVDQQTLSDQYPLAFKYLNSMKCMLEQRKGFAGWEKKMHSQHFYTLQRVGPYTFSRYKVCWRYIANEFTVCVISNDDTGRMLIPNDKVMFIPFDSIDEAYFVAGILSSKLVRGYVNTLIEKRQISTKVIKNVFIPDYDCENALHSKIGKACLAGHQAILDNEPSSTASLRKEIDSLVLCLMSDQGRVQRERKFLQAQH